MHGGHLCVMCGVTGTIAVLTATGPEREGTVAAPGPDTPARIPEGEKRLHCSSSYCHFGGYLHFLTQIHTVFLQRYGFLPVALFPLFVIPGWQ